MISIHTTPIQSLNEITIFSFDDYSIPYKKDVNLTLNQTEKHPANPLITPGPKGSPDDVMAEFYGTVLHIDGKFRMWYSALCNYDPATGDWEMRVAYAESDDGIHWVKPNLGLAEFNGSRENNLVQLPVDRALFPCVLYEPDDPNPSRRYKMGNSGVYTLLVIAAYMPHTVLTGCIGL